MNTISVYGAPPPPEGWEPPEPVQWPPKGTTAEPRVVFVPAVPDPPPISTVFAQVVAALERLPLEQQRRVVEALRILLEGGGK